MKDSGITLKLDPQTDVQKLVAMRKSNQTELTLNAVSSDLFDVTDVATTIFTGNGLYTNPKVDSLITEANKTIDASKRLVITKEISRTVMADVAWIPLYSSSINSAFTKKNYTITHDWYADLGVYFWKGYSQ
jgi:ABC-type transport system substrate-binding protein